MTVDLVLDGLIDLGAQCYVDIDGQLHFVGPAMPDDPLLAALIEHRLVLTEIFSYAPGGRCTAEGCYRHRRSEGGMACTDHSQGDAGGGA